MAVNSGDFPVGTQFGNYVIIEKVGVGGIGTVYKARHKLLNSIAAVKVHEHFPADEVVGVAFLQAANYLSQLNHPNIVKLYDYGFQHNRAYMAMEFIEGQTLAALIPRQQTEEWTQRALQYSLQMLTAVRYAHGCIYLNLAGDEVEGILHGDIKPQNVFVNRDGGIVKLSDFMIPDVQVYLGKEEPDFKKLLEPYAKPLTRRERARLTSRMMDVITAAFGTPAYMPPEQWGGRVSEQTDIFTLGATMYEVLTSRSPMYFVNGKKPRQLNPFIPQWVEEVIIRAMKPEPSERYVSVSEIESIFREKLSDTKAAINFLVKEWFMGDKIDINNTGTISNTGGQMFIGKFNDVFVNLNTAGQTELAEALKTLKEAVMASSHIPEAKKQEHVEVINQIGEEAAKEKPNKTLLKIIGDGLLSTLKAVPDIAKAVAAVAPLLTFVK